MLFATEEYIIVYATMLIMRSYTNSVQELVTPQTGH